jgi:DNA-binding CsgD family transcriptional regulator
MFLPLVSEFVEYLSLGEKSLEEILGHCVVSTLRPLNASSAFIWQLEQDGNVQEVAKFGTSSAVREAYPLTYKLSDKNPVCDAVRSRSVLWMNIDGETWASEYPDLAGLSKLVGEKTIIVFPIEHSGTPIAVMAIFCDQNPDPDAEVEAFLRAVGSLISMNFHGRYGTKVAQTGTRLVRQLEATEAGLTDRQELVLRLMSEDRTNGDISEMLGYSESTIRQETIKIFRKLQCNGREEAARIYRSNFIDS